MSDYVMMPGARLEIGPGGKPYESLGACCASCAMGDVALSPPGMTAPGTGVRMNFMQQIQAKVRERIAAAKAASAGGGGFLSSSSGTNMTPYYIAGAVGLGVLALVVLRKKSTPAPK